MIPAERTDEFFWNLICSRYFFTPVKAWRTGNLNANPVYHGTAYLDCATLEQIKGMLARERLAEIAAAVKVFAGDLLKT